MSKKVKKIIAREWLILLIFISTTLILSRLTHNANAILLLAWVYPAYALIRFTIWAIKTLVTKE